MATCCPPGSLRYLQANNTHDKGKCVSIDCDAGECDFYLSVPSQNYDAFDTNMGVIIVPDIWGWNSGRTREVADIFAERGFATVVAKILVPALEGGTDGDGFPKDFSFATRGADFGPYLLSLGWENTFKPRIRSIVKFLQSRSVTNIGMVGFCWGGWVVGCALMDDDVVPSIICGVSPHPSLTIEERIFGGNTVDFINKIRKPMLFLPAGNDPAEYKRDGIFFQTIVKNNPLSEVIAEFDDMIHGWVVRGDMNDPNVKAQADKAVNLTVDYLNKFL